MDSSNEHTTTTTNLLFPSFECTKEDFKLSKVVDEIFNIATPQSRPLEAIKGNKSANDLSETESDASMASCDSQSRWSTASIASDEGGLARKMDKFIFKGGCSKTFPIPERAPRNYSLEQKRLWTLAEHRNWVKAWKHGAIDGIKHKIDH